MCYIYMYECTRARADMYFKHIALYNCNKDVNQPHDGTDSNPFLEKTISA